MSTATDTPGVAPQDAPIGALRRWAITATVMMVTIMQVLDVTVTNVALPHMQGSLSAGVDEVSWVLTSYLAANAVILPATGWLAGVLGRKRFFLFSTAAFTGASVLCGLAPNLTMLLIARTLQGIGGGPLIPLSQAIMWEIFPFRQRGMAMAVWGMGIMMAPIFGPTLGDGSRTTGRGGGSSTSTCRSVSSAHSPRARSCSILRTCASQGASTPPASC